VPRESDSRLSIVLVPIAPDRHRRSGGATQWLLVVGEAWELALMFVLVIGNLVLLVLLQRWFGLS
jgi:hypothetical protein